MCKVTKKAKTMTEQQYIDMVNLSVLISAKGVLSRLIPSNISDDEENNNELINIVNMMVKDMNANNRPTQ